MKDLVIIGAGPAGLSAAVYAFRAGIDFEIIEKNYMAGGQVLLTYEVDNYLGMPMINGFDMGIKFKEHAEKMGISIKNADVKEIKKDGENFIVLCEGEEIKAKTILVTTGAQYRHLDVQGETELTGKGVSYCATCDGAFYKGKTTAVIGGSYTAVEDAIYLSALCEKVYLIHRRDKLRAGAVLEKKLLELPNVEVLWNTTVEKINGESKISSLNLDTKGDKMELEIDGAFIAVGTVPDTEMIKNLVETDKSGYVIADESCKTSLNGLFVAGDLRTKPLRQIITAVSDGANAITSIWSYIMGEN